MKNSLPKRIKREIFRIWPIRKGFFKKRVGLIFPAKQSDFGSVSGKKLKEIRKAGGTVFLGGRVLDHLLKHKKTIPRYWKRGVRINGVMRIKFILFLGTLRKDNSGREYVRSLYFDGKDWKEERFYLYNNENWGFGNNFAAAILKPVSGRRNR